MLNKAISILLFLASTLAAACTDDAYFVENKKTDVISGCLIWSDMMDEHNSDYVCVDATQWVCDFRFGERVEERCETAGFVDCEDGTWTDYKCLDDPAGACVWTMDGSAACYNAFRGECLYEMDDAEWSAAGCADAGYLFYCDLLDMWTQDEAACLSL